MQKQQRRFTFQNEALPEFLEETRFYELTNEEQAFFVFASRLIYKAKDKLHLFDVERNFDVLGTLLKLQSSQTQLLDNDENARKYYNPVDGAMVTEKIHKLLESFQEQSGREVFIFRAPEYRQRVG